VVDLMTQLAMPLKQLSLHTNLMKNWTLPFLAGRAN
jgi:hypothetical protein